MDTGESEAKLRSLFQEAADISPCIVFIGESLGFCAHTHTHARKRTHTCTHACMRTHTPTHTHTHTHQNLGMLTHPAASVHLEKLCAHYLAADAFV